MIKGVLIIANGYANNDFGGTRFKKIIAWGYAKSLKGQLVEEGFSTKG